MTLAALIAGAAPSQAQQLTLASRAINGTPGNGASFHGALSGDGLWVAFASDAANLVPGDTNGKTDVFLKNLATHVVTRLSLTSTGTQADEHSGTDGVDLNGSGSVIAFSAMAPLVPGDTNSCALESGQVTSCPDIYVRNNSADTLTRVSVPTGADAQADGRSRRPRLSEDGRFVVFSSFATNLVPGDTNGVEDVFVHDLQTGTTTRVSIAIGGAQIDGPAFDAVISNDGTIVAFLSTAAILNTTPDPLPCPAGPCPRAYVHDRTTGTTTPVRVGSPTFDSNVTISEVSIDGQGRFIAVGVLEPGGIAGVNVGAVLYDRLQQRTVRTLGPVGRRPFGDDTAQFGAGISGDGHVLMQGGGRFQAGALVRHTSFSVFDRHTGVFEPAQSVDLVNAPNIIYFENIDLNTNGLRLAFTTSRAVLAEDVTPFSDVYVFNRDVDGDTVADAWETQFGLNPTDPIDATFDSDGDLRFNLLEYQDGSHPTATRARYFAEGASNVFFDTRIAVLNPGANPARVLLRFLSNEGLTSSIVQTLAPHTRATFDLGAIANLPSSDFSTVIESDQPVVADRTMTWDAGGYGSHAETAVEAPSMNWFLAEGATHGSFDTFYLLQNANASDVLATVTFLRPTPQAPVVRQYLLTAHSRRTIWVDTEDPALADTDVSAEISATAPIIVERAMYMSVPGQPAFAAGHEGAGVTAPATTWFLAEGATGTFFDLYVLIANPGLADGSAAVTYLLPDGTTITKAYPVEQQSRRTISVKGEDARLAETSVAVKVESTQPVVVERAMWWPSPDWYEGHLAGGTTTTGTQWALAEGEVGGNANAGGTTETYILIANTGGTPGSATVTLYHEGATATPASSQLIVQLAANSRMTIPVSSSFPAADFAPSRRFGAVIQSSGVPIVVERAMYTTIGGLLWSAGTAALATKLQ